MTATDLLERQFLEMRWRALSLAADFDRIARAEGGEQLLSTDPRLKTLREALKLLTEPATNRAEKLQLLFSDLTPPSAPDDRKLNIENRK
jgi:hypothetical protein